MKRILFSRRQVALDFQIAAAQMKRTRAQHRPIWLRQPRKIGAQVRQFEIIFWNDRQRRAMCRASSLGPRIERLGLTAEFTLLWTLWPVYGLANMDTCNRNIIVAMKSLSERVIFDALDLICAEVSDFGQCFY